MNWTKINTVKIIPLLTLMLSFTSVSAQQVPIYTMQEMYRTGINPAYTGLDGVYDLVLLSRQQWIGFNGAPKSYYLASNVPLRNRKTGVGFVFQDLSSRPSRQTGFFLNYSYSVQLTETSFLSFGLRGGLNSYSIKVSDLRVIDQGDYLFENDVNTLFLPNVGTGIHYKVRNYCFDFSVPLMLRNEFRPDGVEKAGRQNREDRIFNFQSSANFAVSEGITLQPAIATWLAKGVPPLIDFRLSAEIQDVINFGLVYRLSGSFSGYFTFRISENLVLGYAYELPLSYDYRLSSGTHEIVLGLDFQLFNRKTLSPRRF